MPVLAGIVPAHAVVGEGAALGADSERQLVRRDRRPAAAQISPLLCIVGRGSTAICMMPGISAERLLPEMAYLIATFFTPR